MLAGAASAVLTSPGGWPDQKGRLPIWPTRITTTSTMYMPYADHMRLGGSTTSAGVLPVCAAIPGRPAAAPVEAPATRRGAEVVADSCVNRYTSAGRQYLSRTATQA